MTSKRIKASMSHTLFTLKKFIIFWCVVMGFALQNMLSAFMSGIEFSAYVFATIITFSTVVVLPAIWFASSSFNYLNSRKEMDFYHAQPVTRKVMFWTRYAMGYLAVITPMLMIYGISIGFELLNSIGGEFFGGLSIINVLITIMIVCAAVFCIYNLCVFARMICGNAAIAFICAVFLTILPGAILFLIGTVIDRHSLFLPDILTNFEEIIRLTPYHLLYILPNGSIVGEGYITLENWITLIWQMAATSGLVVFASIIYNRRKSEHAGKPIVFKSALVILKCLVVIVVSMFGGWLFYMISGNQPSWEIAGYIIIGILVFAILNVVEEYDIKKVFKHGIQFLVIAVIFASTVSGAYAYAKQADAYIPSFDSIESINVTTCSYSKPITDSETLKQLYKIAVDNVESLTMGEHAIMQLPMSIKLKSGITVKRVYYVYEDETYSALMANRILFEASDSVGALDKKYFEKSANKYGFVEINYSSDDFNHGYYLSDDEALEFMYDHLDTFKDIVFMNKNRIVKPNPEMIHISFYASENSIWNSGFYGGFYMVQGDELFEYFKDIVMRNYEHINDYKYID